MLRMLMVVVLLTGGLAGSALAQDGGPAGSPLRASLMRAGTSLARDGWPTAAAPLGDTMGGPHRAEVLPLYAQTDPDREGERRQIRRARQVIGAIVGTLVGFSVGGALGTAVGCDCSDASLAALTTWVPIGGAIGGVAGFQIGSRW